MHRRTQSDAQATIFSKLNQNYKIKAKRSCNQIQKLIKKSEKHNKCKVTFIESLNSSELKTQGSLFQFGRLSNMGNSHSKPHHQNFLDTILQKRAVNQIHNEKKNVNKQNNKSINKADKTPKVVKMIIPDWIKGSKFEERLYQSQRHTPNRQHKMVQKQSQNFMKTKQKLKTRSKKVVMRQKNKKIAEKSKKL